MTRRARAAVLGLAVALTAVSAAPAQPPPERSPFLVGTHAFRRILYDAARHKVKALSPAELGGDVDPAETLIVVLGKPTTLDELEGRPRRWQGTGLNTFVREGGALLIATDQETPWLAASFRWSVTGEQLKVPAGSAAAYRGMAECPFIDPVPGQEPALFRPSLPALRGLEPPRVAANLASYLLRSPPNRFAPGLPVLARLPAECVDDRGRSGPRDFAAGGELGGNGGRVLLMADHSVFINEMMLQTDNGNIDFAYRCADWLLAGPHGRRDRVLFYEDGEVRTDFDIPLKSLPPPPLPPPDTLLGMLGETVHSMEEEGTFARMEEEDFFNGTVEDLMRSAPFWERTPPEWKIWTLLVAVGSVVLGLYAFVRLGTFRHRPDAAAPTLAALLARHAPAGAVMEQRHDALLRDGNVWEAAREVARQLLASAGAPAEAGPLPPALAVRGTWWRRWRVRRLWARLWRLARSARPVRVSPRDAAPRAAAKRACHDGHP